MLFFYYLFVNGTSNRSSAQVIAIQMLIIGAVWPSLIDRLKHQSFIRAFGIRKLIKLFEELFVYIGTSVHAEVIQYS